MAMARDEAITGVAMPQGMPAEVEAWRIDLDRYMPPVGAGNLDDQEQRKASRFHFARDRARYIAGRLALRTLLADRLVIDPGEVRLVADTFGKPSLCHPSRQIHFNVSHSGPVALIAFCRSMPIGVDIELMRHVADAGPLAEAHFSDRERQALQAAAPACRDPLFLQVWTRKEAVLKAVGIGLDVDLRRVHAGWGDDFHEVPIVGSSPARSALACKLEVRGIPTTIAAIAMVAASTPRGKCPRSASP